MYMSWISEIIKNMNNVDVIISGALVLIISIILAILSRRVLFSLSFIIVFVLALIGVYSEYTLLAGLGFVLLFAIIAGVFVIYTQEIVTSLSKKKKKRQEDILDNEDKRMVLDIVENAVLTLSATKTGAIITFEKEQNLDEYIHKGEAINAPVTSELLRTIFYPGTPLHDGAVIIRDTTIVAASVYYIPTTKAMTGKFGARHRAAIGFSEVSDGITVVVSEETGRISFAIGGELIPAPRDGFRRRLEEYLGLND